MMMVLERLKKSIWAVITIYQSVQVFWTFWHFIFYELLIFLQIPKEYSLECISINRQRQILPFFLATFTILNGYLKIEWGFNFFKIDVWMAVSEFFTNAKIGHKIISSFWCLDSNFIDKKHRWYLFWFKEIPH